MIFVKYVYKKDNKNLLKLIVVIKYVYYVLNNYLILLKSNVLFVSRKNGFKDINQKKVY